MTLIQFYGVLATTASIFVGILTAYLVTRLSDLKSERERLRQRIESIDAELRVLKGRFNFRIDRLEETEERWRRTDIEDDVDDFIEYTVGSNWDPPPDRVTLEDVLDALTEYRNLRTDELTEHHVDVIEHRWEDMIDELQPRTPIESVANTSNSTYDAANWIREALWEIYDREKYDHHDKTAMDIRREVEKLRDEREVLVEQYDSLDPKQLRESIKAAIVPIALSVVLPLLIRFFYELGWTWTVPSPFALLEPIGVFVAWLVGFLWTLRFVWIRVADVDEKLPESPLSNEGPDGENEGGESEADEEGETKEVPIDS